MKPLAEQSCQSIAKGSLALETSETDKHLSHISQWNNLDYQAIERDFKFRNFLQTMAFVNQVADIAHHCNHHPDMQVGYNHCRVTYTTHAVNGLSINDFICAAKINLLVNDE